MTAKKAKSNSKKAVVISVIIALVIGVVTSVCLISQAKNKDKPVYYDFGKSLAQGIDVSEHNKKIDWKKVKKSQDFAFIRVGYRGYGTGELLVDKRAEENLKGANKANLPVGVYFYSQATNEKEARQEARLALKQLRHHDIQLPVVIDFEYACDNDGNRAGRLYEAHNTPKANADIINAFCKVVADEGYIPGVYASSSVFFRDIDTKKLSKDIVIWVADYNAEVSYKVRYDIWQYSKTGSVDGVESKAVDLDYWYNK